jgi:hypothetical protein
LSKRRDPSGQTYEVLASGISYALLSVGAQQICAIGKTNFVVDIDAFSAHETAIELVLSWISGGLC